MLILGLAFDLTHHVLVHTGYILHATYFLGAGNATTYLLGPLLFYYVKALCNPSFSFRWTDLVHLFPFMIFQWIRLPDYLAPRAEKTAFLMQYYAEVAAGTRVESASDQLIGFFLFSLLPLLYVVVTIRLIHQAQRLSSLSNTSLFRLRRIRVVLIGFGILILHYPVLSIASHFADLPFSFRDSTIVVLSIQIYSLAYLALKHSVGWLTPQLRTVGQDPKKRHTERRLIQSYMIREKPFLDPQLNLQSFSEQVGLPSHKVSRLINGELGMSFTDFVHRFRIEEAKRMLLDPAHAHLTIEAIGATVGFNSRKTFYRAFKKHCGQTPTSFKRLNKEQTMTPTS